MVAYRGARSSQLDTTFADMALPASPGDRIPGARPRHAEFALLGDAGPRSTVATYIVAADRSARISARGGDQSELLTRRSHHGLSDLLDAYGGAGTWRVRRLRKLEWGHRPAAGGRCAGAGSVQSAARDRQRRRVRGQRDPADPRPGPRGRPLVR